MTSPNDSHEKPQTLPYRSPTDEPPPVGLKRLSGCALVVLTTWFATVWGGIAIAGVVGGHRYLRFLGGVLVVVAFVFLAMRLQNSPDLKHRYYAAGMWIGVAISVLLIGLCSSVLR